MERGWASTIRRNGLITLWQYFLCNNYADPPFPPPPISISSTLWVDDSLPIPHLTPFTRPLTRTFLRQIRMSRVQGDNEEHPLGKESNCLVQQKLLFVCPLSRRNKLFAGEEFSSSCSCCSSTVLVPSLLSSLRHKPSWHTFSGSVFAVQEVDDDTLGINRWRVGRSRSSGR